MTESGFYTFLALSIVNALLLLWLVFRQSSVKAMTKPNAKFVVKLLTMAVPIGKNSAPHLLPFSKH